MSNGKLGSSSYEAGDTGGSCGDYEHGVGAVTVGPLKRRKRRGTGKRRAKTPRNSQPSRAADQSSPKDKAFQKKLTKWAWASKGKKGKPPWKSPR